MPHNYEFDCPRCQEDGMVIPLGADAVRCRHPQPKGWPTSQKVKSEVTLVSAR